jgi:hypothetical protein
MSEELRIKVLRTSAADTATFEGSRLSWLWVFYGVEPILKTIRNPVARSALLLPCAVTQSSVAVSDCETLD